MACVRCLGFCLGIASVLAIPSLPFDDEIKAEDIFVHLRALQAVADKHGSRAVATGYNDSAAYVLQQLHEHTNYNIRTQPFTVPIFDEVSPPTLTLLGFNPPLELERCSMRTGWQHYEQGCDYAGVRYGGSGRHDVTTTVTHVGDGCDPAAWTKFAKGTIALIVTGGCEYYDKAVAAEKAGAVGVIFYNPSGTPGFPGGRVFNSDSYQEGDTIPSIPCIGVTHAIGILLQQEQNADAQVRLETDTTITVQHTFNIIAETASGDDDHVAMIGAHLDGVPEGPGINDNGSGTSTVLAIALRLANRRWRNKIRFAWWGAEEVGLIGSRFYVRNLLQTDPRQLDQHALYLNFDMEASPNFIRLIYNGSEAEHAQAGSEALMHMFEDHFRTAGLSYALTSMGGGSDFLPFILAGIPSSGLATGASGIKSIEERGAHGGLANTQMDPCYHAPCDSVDNVSEQCVTEAAAAAIDVLVHVAEQDTTTLGQRRPVDVAASLNRLDQPRSPVTCLSDEEH